MIVINDYGSERTAFVTLVNKFRKRIFEKLEKKSKEEYKKPLWDKSEQLPKLKKMIQLHIEKGDMVDVAIIAMFIWNLEGDGNYNVKEII